MKHVFPYLKSVFLVVWAIVASVIIIVFISYIWNLSFRRLQWGNDTKTYREYWRELIEFIKDEDPF